MFYVFLGSREIKKKLEFVTHISSKELLLNRPKCLQREVNYSNAHVISFNWGMVTIIKMLMMKRVVL